MDNRVDYGIYNELVYDYVLPIYKWGVLSELQVPLSFKTKEAGVVQLNDTGMNSTNSSDVSYLTQYYRDKMDFYIRRCRDYIREKVRSDGWVVSDVVDYYKYYPIAF